MPTGRQVSRFGTQFEPLVSFSNIVYHRVIEKVNRKFLERDLVTPITAWGADLAPQVEARTLE